MAKKLRTILSYLILFILSLIFLILTILTILNLTIFNKNYLLKELSKNNYYENIYNDVKTEMTYYTGQSGFVDAIIDDTFTLSEIEEELNNFIINFYDNQNYEINTQSFEEKLNDKINETISNKNNVVFNKDDLERFTGEMAKIYNNKITFMGYLNIIMNIFNKIRKIVKYAIIALIISMIILILINKVFFKRKDYSIILFTNIFLLLGIEIYLKNTINIGSIFIYSKIVSDIIVVMINDIFLIINIVIIIYFILGIILNIIKDRIKQL